MKIKEIISKIENDFPLISCYDFDNSGSNVVDGENELTGVLLTVDVTLEAIDIAKKNNCNLIISHHPLIFYPMKQINGDIISQRIKALIRNDISSYACHTNFDVNLTYGMGKSVVEKYEVLNGQIKKWEHLENRTFDNKNYGLGDVIYLNNNIEFDCLLDGLIKSFSLSKEKISFYKNKEKIDKLIIIPGSGSGDVNAVIKEKPDLFITSDLKHNNILDLYENGISYIDATHYGLEKCFVDAFYDYLLSTQNVNAIKYYSDWL